MVDLSLGQVAGVIATGIFIASILFHLLIPLILVGLLNLDESAATWSRASRTLLASFWPTVLQTDATVDDGVRLPVRIVTQLGPLAAFLLSAASIITPLGLYESVAQANELQNVRFEYARDSSVFGIGSLPQPAEGFNRICGTDFESACPFSGNNITVTRNNTVPTMGTHGPINISIPPGYMNYLSSGVAAIGQTVSSIFDIAYRVYGYRIDNRRNLTNAGQRYPIGHYAPFSTLLLEEDYHLIEGLIVDTKVASIGFRNHTIPVAGPYGAAWKEDILFIEPQTQCVDTNTSFEWSVPVGDIYSLTEVADLILVDNGGFVNFDTTYPEYDSVTAQNDPQLAYRAYRAAWFINAYTALFYNLTNPSSPKSGMKAFSYMESQIGKKIPMIRQNFTATITPLSQWWDPHKLMIGNFGHWIDKIPRTHSNGTLLSDTLSSDVNVPLNPWSITGDNFTDARNECSVVYGSDRGNSSNILSFCGGVLAVPQPKGPPPVVAYDLGSSYVQPVYGCASVVRAVIKTVSFQFNGTGLPGLTVTQIEEKKYDSPDEYPNWGVETSDMPLREGNPLWGIVDPDAENEFKANVSIVKKPDLWLPGWHDGVLSGVGAISQNLPGLEFWSSALNVAYSTSSSPTSGSFDYSGANSLGLSNLWKNLSRTPEGTAKAINLVWTDVSANLVVGTKAWTQDAGGLQKRQDASGVLEVLVPVHPYSRHIHHRLVYAIPAFVTLALLALTIFASLIMTILGQTGLARVQLFLIKSSVGRAITSLLYRDTVSAVAPTKVWVERVGRLRIDYKGKIPKVPGVCSPAVHSYNTYDSSYPMLASKDTAVVGSQGV